MAQDIWAETFKYMADNKVMFEGILLKPSMVTPGADGSKKEDPATVADYTLKLLKWVEAALLCVVSFHVQACPATLAGPFPQAAHPWQ